MRKALVLDTQLAVLLVVGNADRGYIERHKRLSAYRSEDHDLLCRVVDRFRSLICSVNVLTETSNLTRQISEPMKSEIAASLRRLILHCEEIYSPSVNIAPSAEFRSLGLTDAGLLAILNHDRVLLTADLPLYLEAMQKGLVAVSFAHLQENEMQLSAGF
ncbi:MULTISPECIES: PIN domain-containing protein [unclassified Aureimonas]|uniref:PIN domain-containing protein n=1 Tax=unclassified Aureimonas TaxID=2615206 RepID=UPI000700B646|nr:MULTISPECIES: PIN domain-containing protein [unclassified Aureimonas]KQT52818.1 hypothetical protein ASG62_12900 [Aureimonas sp. Leaf427]KQT80278.1 hypothetical protein ASG54_06750 [Aureimonas sp. Leaf460]